MRRKKIRRITFMLALLLSLTVWGVAGSVRCRKYEARIGAAQQRALLQTGEYLDSMETALQKAVCAGTPAMLGALSAQLYAQSVGAKTGLAALSSGETDLWSLQKFLSQVGAYTEALSRRVSAGETLGAEDRETLRALLGYAESLSAQFAYMAQLMDAGQFSFDEAAFAAGDPPADTVSYAGAAADAEESMHDFPTLIYDGPYSDHMTEKTSALLSRAAQVSLSQAKARAAAALGVRERQLIEEDEAGGKLPVYRFCAGSARVAVTCAGGYVAYILSDDAVGEEKLRPAEAMDAAAAFLARVGYENMEPTYFVNENGVCIVNFAYCADGYVCYPDLIKVGISLGDGHVVSMDARDYLMNHIPRAIPAAALTPGAAQAALSPELTVKKTARAVIPTPGGYEKYAYEFLCADAAGQDVLVYVDTTTGQEDDILILLYADGGTLTK